MAEYEKVACLITEEALARDGFGTQPALSSLIAEWVASQQDRLSFSTVTLVSESADFFWKTFLFAYNFDHEE